MTHQKVVVIATGGTIAMRYDPVRRAVFPAVTGRELLEAIPPLSAVCPVEIIEFSNIPSPHMTPQMMFHLAGCIDNILEQENVAGMEPGNRLLCFTVPLRRQAFLSAIKQAPAQEVISDSTRKLAYYNVYKYAFYFFVLYCKKAGFRYFRRNTIKLELLLDSSSSAEDSVVRRYLNPKGGSA